MTNYDIIGDVHGHPEALRSLPERLGCLLSRSAFHHLSRTAVFESIERELDYEASFIDENGTASDRLEKSQNKLPQS